MPRFLLKFMDHIEKKGLDSVGLYRLSGNAASVQKLMFLVEAGECLGGRVGCWRGERGGRGAYLRVTELGKRAQQTESALSFFPLRLHPDRPGRLRVGGH